MLVVATASTPEPIRDHDLVKVEPARRSGRDGRNPAMMDSGADDFDVAAAAFDLSVAAPDLNELSHRLTGYETTTVAFLAPKLGAPERSSDSRAFMANGVELQGRLARVYSISGHRTEIVVPDDYARRLDAVREFRLRLQGGSGDSPNRIDPELFSRALPEDFIPHLDVLPDSGLVGRLCLLDDPNPIDAWYQQHLEAPWFVSQASAHPDHVITFFRKTLDDYIGDEFRHEWSHLARWESPRIGDVFDKAARFEGYGGVHRDRATADGDEDWAVHMGEQLLHPDATVFFDLTRDCPLRAVFLAEALTDILDRRSGWPLRSVPGPLARRLTYIHSVIKPEVVQYLLEEVVTSPDETKINMAARLLIQMGEGARLAETKLTRLDVKGEFVGDHLLSRLANCATLTVLDLTSTRAGARSLDYLQSLPLTTLSLSGTPIHSGSLHDLGKILTLRHLDLSYTDLSDQRLVALRWLTSLQTLNIVGSYERSDDGSTMIEWLRANMPDTEILA